MARLAADCTLPRIIVSPDFTSGLRTLNCHVKTLAYAANHSVNLAHQTDWKNAGKIGFFLGCAFLFVTAANPWGFSALIVPTVMGREIFAPATRHFSSGLVVVHLGLATVFSLMMAPVLQKLRIIGAILASVPFGLLFYGVNFVLFRIAFPIHYESGEVGVLLTNLAFALIVASTYRGLARSRAGA